VFSQISQRDRDGKDNDLSLQHWPLFVPQEILIFITKILLKRQQQLRGSESSVEDNLVVSIWRSFLNSLAAHVSSSSSSASPMDVQQQQQHQQQDLQQLRHLNNTTVNEDHLYLLLFLFHTLSRDSRVHLFNECLSLLQRARSNLAAVSTSHETNSNTFFLAVARLLFIMDCILTPHSCTSLTTYLVARLFFLNVDFLKIFCDTLTAFLKQFPKLLKQSCYQQRQLPALLRAPASLLLLHSINQRSLQQRQTLQTNKAVPWSQC
jgi:hypothetical protein